MHPTIATATQIGRGRKGRCQSKKRLFADLAALFPALFADAPEKGLKHPRVGNETFGKQSCIFLHVGTDKRRIVERALQAAGHRVNEDYWPGSGRVQVTVTYFKGWHWDE